MRKQSLIKIKQESEDWNGAVGCVREANYSGMDAPLAPVVYQRPLFLSDSSTNLKNSSASSGFRRLLTVL